jgi:alpha-soluble NSF attachment protein
MELYQTVADWSLTSALTKYSVKEYWLRAALCSMAMGVSPPPTPSCSRATWRDTCACEVGLTSQDLVTTNRLLQTFAQKDVTFPSTREAKFAHELMLACEEADVEHYTAQIYQYDQVTKLDNWKTGVLLRIKKALEEDEGGLT